MFAYMLTAVEFQVLREMPFSPLDEKEPREPIDTGDFPHTRDLQASTKGNRFSSGFPCSCRYGD
jgi:hypothetical protein